MSETGPAGCPERAGRRAPLLLAALLWLAPGATGQELTGERFAEAAAFLDAAAAEGSLSGVVLIAVGDDIRLHRGYGSADYELGVAMTTDHILRLGSLTKPITASAALAAVDRGSIFLDDAVCDRLPSCPISWRDVRLRHVMSHVSGIPDRFGALESVPVDDTFLELTRVLESIPADEPLESDPGADYAYSNFNYVLVGAVLEQALGMPWEDALGSLVFDPLGLSTMAYDDVFAIVPGRARGYSRDESGRLGNTEYDDHAAYAAGGLRSTAGDLFSWSRAVLTARLFSEELLRRSLTPNDGMYGLGWQVRRFFDRPVYNHTGGIDGFSSHLAHYPEQELTIIVLSNVEEDSAILRACDIASILFGWRSPTESSGPSLTPRARCGLEPR